MAVAACSRRAMALLLEQCGSVRCDEPSYHTSRDRLSVGRTHFPRRWRIKLGENSLERAESLDPSLRFGCRETGRPASKETVSVREKASTLVLALAKANLKPSTSRDRIFDSSVGKSVLPIRSTRAIRQKSFAKTPVAKGVSADSSTPQGLKPLSAYPIAPQLKLYPSSRGFFVPSLLRAQCLQGVDL
jgi:hypothetical protein